MTPKEQSAVDEVNRFVEAATGLKRAWAPETRLVIAALKAVGLDHHWFRARLQVSESGQRWASGHLFRNVDCAKVVKNARLLVLCGLNVHVLEQAPGAENAFVTTPKHGTQPRVVRYARVSGRF